MKGKHSLFYHILIFVLAQLVWLSLLGIWIYWYVSNYLTYEKVGGQVSPQLLYDVQNAIPFVLGLVLLIGLSFITSVIFRDLNVQLRLRELYDNFIGNVTHELKSPLSSIQLYLETLRQRDVPAEKQKEFLDMMMKDADRLQHLINSILEISAQEKGKHPGNFRIYDASHLIKSVLEESFDRLRIKKENFKIEGEAQCEIIADKDSLRIVFDNLADNAVKYATKAVNIDVRMNSDLHSVFIDFCDDGIGISPKEKKKIFKKFYRISGKNIPNVKGTGLGLYQVKQIIKVHGGKVNLVSDNENTGSVFRIELPVYDESKRRFKKLIRKQTDDEE
jgi:two-component system phosphate regulon sensor histidine kinase PhoR